MAEHPDDRDYDNLHSILEDMIDAAIVLSMSEQPTPFRGTLAKGFESTDGNWRITAIHRGTRITGGDLYFQGGITYGPAERPEAGKVVHDPERWIRFDPHTVVAKWTNRVNDAFRPWRDLPEPGSFNHAIDVWNRATTLLSPRVDVAKRIDDDGHTLQGMLGSLLSVPGKGDTMAAFRSNVATPLKDTVVPYHRDVAALAKLTLKAEKELWIKARHDTAAIARAAVRAYEHSGSVSLRDLVGVVETVAGLVALVPGLQASGTLAGLAGTVGQLLGEEPDPPKKPYDFTGRDARGIHRAACDALHRLNNQIKSEERKLSRLCRQVAHNEKRHRELFDVTEATYGPVPRGRGTALLSQTDVGGIIEKEDRHVMDLDFQSLRQAANHTIPDVAAEIQDVRRLFGETVERRPWHRPGTIGIDDNGPYDAWHSMIHTLDREMNSTARHLHDCSEHLKIIVRDVTAEDHVIHDRLLAHQRHVEKIESGFREGIKH